MAAFLVDKRDQLFVLNEMLELNKMCELEKFAEHTGFDMVLTEAHRFAKNEFYPTLQDGDRQGCVYDPQTQTVRFPECFKKPYQNFREGGWLAMCDSPVVGGDGFPLTIGTAVSEIFYASGFYIYGAAELSHAGAKVLEKYGTESQKELYMTRLFSGEWMGTMCLTEPDAGSDVGKVETRAIPQPDGTYIITGTKIFITAGEHDLTPNIIHMVLARVKGDPPGTKGLSLFIVPKFLSDENGTITTRNDVKCMGIEHKMGLHGLVTCTMAFGNNDACTGYLLGDRGKGIVEMFNMMNEQRLLVGLQGLSYSSAAFLHAVDYAGTRKQGLSVYPDRRDKGSAAIIEHPDIKRMLLTLKSHVEGGRALAYFTSMCMDYAAATEGETRSRWQGLVELLTPIVKAYLTNNAWEDTGMAIQCAGGYGYCSDYPFERLARDCKVSSIYEGANGIQAIDLVFRKIIGNRSVNFDHLMACMDQTIRQAETTEALAAYAAIVQQARQDLEGVVHHLADLSESGRSDHVYAKASPFLEAMGDVVLGWLHLWQLSIVVPKLSKEMEGKAQSEAIQSMKKKKNLAFYYGKISSAQFYIGTLLKRTDGKLKELKSSSDPVVDIFEKAFTG
ncbi:acyl-CoA dehydrogenase [Desulfosarcina widdelii]|uniref:3-methylmercaptopropionyl-CoA dehydrogenase n=1 Tax=Desulfosarcina widdelii TaxID=947919 RepID=A0A5K7Z5F4_9BACT|nr:acyl-CoA dehydrogenase [Desulfosarcina widdelii]BBO75950.1 acyl-CoA dehydrogenase [Desulfosarcina widdelii]